MAAKSLARTHGGTFHDILAEFGQIGVAVASGLGALAAWTRRTATDLKEDEVVGRGLEWGKAPFIGANVGCLRRGAPGPVVG